MDDVDDDDDDNDYFTFVANKLFLSFLMVFGCFSSC